MPEVYKPAQLGMMAPSEPTNGLVMVLKPDRNIARVGDAITFEVAIKNTGSQPVLLPAKPDVLLAWVYPDGKCDNFVRDEGAAPAKVTFTPLPPGQSRRVFTSVPTYYFEHLGITEFRARCCVPETDTATAGKPWTGEMTSNGYGVMISR